MTRKRTKYAIKCISPDKNGSARRGRFIEFGKCWGSVARNLRPGDKMLIYVTGTRKIIGFAKVADGDRRYAEQRGERFPHRVRCRWLIRQPASRGVAVSALGLRRLYPMTTAYKPISSRQFHDGLLALVRQNGRSS